VSGDDASIDLHSGPVEAQGMLGSSGADHDDLGKLALEIAQIYEQHSHLASETAANLSVGIPGRRTKRPVRWSLVIGLLVGAASLLGSVFLFTGHGGAVPASSSPATGVARSELGDRTPPGSQVAQSSRPSGSLFAFSGAGSAQSSPIQASSTFVVDWEVSCPMGSQGATVDLEVLSGSQPALLLPIELGSNPQRRGTSPALPAGTYSVQAAAPNPCTWSVVAESKARS
jgi:hypothetical protein